MDSDNFAYTFKNLQKDEFENDSCQKCKEKIDRYRFQLELCNQKEKNHQSSFQKITEIQQEYENRLTQLSKDYKAKEESIKQKYKLKEEMLLKDQKDNESRHEKEFERIKQENGKLQLEIEEHKREIQNLKAQSTNNTTNTRLIKRDFKTELEAKDLQLSTMEAKIKNLTDEANKQIDFLSKQNIDLTNEVNQYRQNDKIVNVNSSYLPNKNSLYNIPSLMKFKSKVTEKQENENELSIQIPSHSINGISQYDVLKIKELRERIKQLEEETINLTRELTLKYEECDSLNDEITKMKLSQENANQYNINNERVNESNAYYQYYNDKDEYSTNKKIEELESLINSYGQNILLIKETYEKVVVEHNNEINTLVQDYESRIDQLLNENNKLKQALNKEEKIKESVQNWHLNIGKYASIGIPKIASNEVFDKKKKDNFQIKIGQNEGKAETISEQMTVLKEKIEEMN